MDALVAMPSHEREREMGTEGKKKGGEGRWQVGPRGAHVEKEGGGERWWRRLALELRLRLGAPRWAGEKKPR